MKYIVGRNNLVYEIHNYLFNSQCKIINVYNNGKNNYELIELVDTMIEYYKERQDNENNFQLSSDNM